MQVAVTLTSDHQPILHDSARRGVFSDGSEDLFDRLRHRHSHDSSAVNLRPNQILVLISNSRFVIQPRPRNTCNNYLRDAISQALQLRGYEIKKTAETHLIWIIKIMHLGYFLFWMR